jgi:hypothetical protein
MQELQIPGFEGQKISVQVANGFGTSKLFVDGQPAPPAEKRGHFLLRHDNGAEVTAHFKGGFPDPVPVLMVGDQAIRLAEPLTWYQWIWTGFPLVLVVLGGLIGGLLGGVATVINVQIFRSSCHEVIKYLLSAVVSVTAICIFGFLALLIHR